MCTFERKKYSYMFTVGLQTQISTFVKKCVYMATQSWIILENRRVQKYSLSRKW